MSKQQLRLISKKFLSLLFVLILSGCAGDPFDAVGKFRFDRQVFEEKFCFGGLNIGTEFENGLYSNVIENSSRYYEQIDGIEKHYVWQNAPERCWAASLETVFRYLGFNSEKYSQDNFVSALKQQCPPAKSESSTANQIIYAATSLHSGGDGKWLGKYAQKGVDIDYCDALNVGIVVAKLGLLLTGNDHRYAQGGCDRQSNYRREDQEFFVARLASDNGQSVSGKLTSQKESSLISKSNIKSEKNIQISVIRSMFDLVEALDSGYPVIVGLKGDSGHTVILQSLSFYPAIDYGKDYTASDGTHIAQAYVLDPLEGVGLRKMTGDELLEKAAFMTYIKVVE